MDGIEVVDSFSETLLVAESSVEVNVADNEDTKGWPTNICHVGLYYTWDSLNRNNESQAVYRLEE